MAAAAVWIRAASHQDRWLRPQLGLLGGFYLLGVLGGGGAAWAAGFLHLWVLGVLGWAPQGLRQARLRIPSTLVWF